MVGLTLGMMARTVEWFSARGLFTVGIVVIRHSACLCSIVLVICSAVSHQVIAELLVIVMLLYMVIIGCKDRHG